MGEQIDIEDLIAQRAMTVAEFAAAARKPLWRVRAAIDSGFLVVDRAKRPMTVKGGEMPLSAQEWRRVLEPETRRIKSSVCPWGNGGREFSLLCRDGTVRTWKITLLKSMAEQQRREIAGLDCQRL